MKLKDIFTQLMYGEMSQLAQGLLLPQYLGPQADIVRSAGSDSEEYRDAANNFQKVLTHLNLGLKEVYKRFFLASKDVIIQMYPHIETYTLDRRYAETNNLSPEAYRYIKDSIFEPFENDLLKIEEVFNEGGELCFLNDRTQPWSLYTPEYNQIQVPFPMWCNSLVVHYRASHPTLEFSPDLTASEEKQKEALEAFLQTDVKIPEGLLEALLMYVAHRAFSSLNVDNNAEGNNYLQKFEQSCRTAERLGLQVETDLTNVRLDQTGWV